MAPAEQLMRLFFSLLIVGGRSSVSDVMFTGSTVEMDFLTALDVLRKAPGSLLRAHTTETILTLRKVSQRLNTNLLCQSEARLPSPPVSDSSSNLNRSTCPRNNQGSLVQTLRNQTPEVRRLVKNLRQTIPWLREIKDKPPYAVIPRKRRLREDRRLSDIRRIEEDGTSSDEDNVLRILALRSLAIDFNKDQIHYGRESKVDELCSQILSPDFDHRTLHEGRRSRATVFVEKNFESSSRSLMIKAVNKGVKHLVFEGLLKHRLQQHNIPDQCEAISAGFAFSIHNFKTIRYDEMPVLVDALLSDGLLLPTEGGKECHFLDALRELNPWFERLQAAYDGEFKLDYY